MMGGALTVDSAPGEGSTFIFELSLETLEAPDLYCPSYQAGASMFVHPMQP